MDLSSTVRFVCNACGRPNTKDFRELTREDQSCECGSTVRFRWIVYAVTESLFGKPVRLPDLPVNKQIRGIGLSDWGVYAAAFAEKLDYTNTFFHCEPRLDIAGEIPDAMRGSLDFLIATEVLEHVVPPVERAFRNIYNLLKPGGAAFITVPWWFQERTVEHYPNLHDYDVEERDGQWRVVNRTRDGRVETFENPVFHGGPGTTLEMRLFSGPELLAKLREAGFDDVRISTPTDLDNGLIFQESWSTPVIARKS